MGDYSIGHKIVHQPTGMDDGIVFIKTKATQERYTYAVPHTN
jgi:hypothetical protein